MLVPGYGILALEVKSHFTVARADDGRWLLGADPPSIRSPFRQASDNMHSVREELARRLPACAALLFCSAVCFPRAVFDVLAPLEWHPWQVIDKETMAREPMEVAILAVLEKARAHVEASHTARWFEASRSLPSERQCEEIARTLRPRYEFFESPESRRRARLDELKRYTDEQFDVLDLMESNRRVLFEGPAGTGKTLLAIEAARRQSLSGATTLLCCFNRLLGRWFASEAASLEGVKATTLHGFMIEVSGLQPPEHATATFWTGALPEAALERLTSGVPAFARFSCLIVDEAQDLLRDRYLAVLDAAITGGLESGPWRFFGDFEHQVIYGSELADPGDLLRDRGIEPTRYPLWTNCRNTPRVATLITLISGLVPGYRRVRRSDNGIEPGWHFYSGETQQASVLEHLLDELRRKGYADHEIVVLSPTESGCATRTSNLALKTRIRDAGMAGWNGIRASTIHAFKGLEVPVVIVTDIEEVSTEATDALMYVAISRATERLELLAHQRTREQFLVLLKKVGMEGSKHG